MAPTHHVILKRFLLTSPELKPTATILCSGAVITAVGSLAVREDSSPPPEFAFSVSDMPNDLKELKGYFNSWSIL